MKKVCCLLVACAMLILPTSYVQPVSALSIDDSLVFQLGVSGYNSSTGAGLSNNAAGSNTTFTVLGASKPALNTLITTTGGQTKYLTFKTYAGATKQNADREINFSDPSFLNRGEMTVSFWMRQTKSDSDWNRIFRFASATAVTFQLVSSAATKYMYYPYTLSTDQASVAFADGQWYHVVMTRKDNLISGKQDCAVYMNGVKTGFCQTTNNSAARVDETGRKMFLGNFTGDMSDVKIYTKAMPQSDVSVEYNATKDNYVGYEADTATTLSVTGVIPADGNKLAKEGGSITLSLNSYPDLATMNDITLTKVGDTANKIIGKSVNLTEKSVTVTYGALTGGESYVLTVGRGIRSITGLTLDNEVVLHYTAEGNVLVDVDFSNERLSGNDAINGYRNPNSATEFDGISLLYYNLTSGFRKKATGSELNFFKIKEKTIGNETVGYLELSDSASTFMDGLLRKVVDVNVDTIKKEGALIVESAVRKSIIGQNSAGENITYNGSTFVNATSAEWPTRHDYQSAYNFGASKAFVPLAFYSNGGISINNTPSHPAKDSHDFFHMRTVYQKNSDGFWYADVYNLTDGSYYTTTNPTQATTQIDDIGFLLFGSAYFDTGSRADHNVTEIRSIKAYRGTTPKATESSGFARANNSIRFTMNQRMQADTLTPQTVSLKAGAEELVSSVSYDDATQTVCVTTTRVLDEGTACTLSFGKGALSVENVPVNSQFSFEIFNNLIDVDGSISYTNQNGTLIHALNGISKLTASFTLRNNTLISKGAIVILALYDGNRLEKLEISDLVTIGGQSTAPASISLENITPSASSKAKLFVWRDSLECGQPLINCEFIPY